MVRNANCSPVTARGRLAGRCRCEPQHGPMALVGPLLEAEVPRRREDQMVQQPDAQQLGGLGQVDRERRVLLAGRGVAGGVVVEHDDEGGADGDGLAKHVSGRRGAAVERAARDDPRGQAPVLRVEQHDAELLDGVGAELRHQPQRQIARRRELPPLVDVGHHGPAPQFERRQHLRGPRRPDAAHLAQLHFGQPQQAARSAAARQQRRRQLECAHRRACRVRAPARAVRCRPGHWRPRE